MSKKLPITIDPQTGEIFSSPAAPANTRFFTPYDRRPPRVYTRYDLPSRTKQEFKDEVDTNLIMQKFLRTGQLDQLSQAKALYLDLEAMPTSYQESLNFVISAREAFEALPAVVRHKYNNDVNAFMEACYHDPEAAFASTQLPKSPATPVAEPPKEATQPQSSPNTEVPTSAPPQK